VSAYVVVGATGNVGRIVARLLADIGHVVRPIGRSFGISLDNPSAIAGAFAGAAGAYLMIPPDPKAPDFRARQNLFGRHLAAAIQASGVPRVVFLSSANAQYSEGTGPVAGLLDVEEQLNLLDGLHLVHLRAAFFMENHLQAIPTIIRAGAYGTLFSPEARFSMVAARDIAQVAVDALIAKAFKQPRVRELLGPKDYTFAEVTRALGEAVDKPNLKYLQLSYEEARHRLLATGQSTSFVEGLLRIARNFNEGKARPKERTLLTDTPTTIEQFAAAVFKPAFEQALEDGPQARL
jgi:uncharacterized protein YbjT (DUF2867 family)